jgi:holliday junction DNA helicase RuvA
MIASLAGHLAAVETDRCTIDVGGVGYLVFASTRTLAALPRPPELARVLVETQVREDAIALYGFADAAERDWFRALTALQGVGAKLALAVLSALAPRDLVAAISAGERASITRVPGVGPRLADRILAELRGKVGALPAGAPATPTVAAPAGRLEDDALRALGGLGFRRAEASEVVARIAARMGAAVTLDALIRDSLRELGPRG